MPKGTNKRSDPNKRNLILGLVLIVLAFLCVVGIFSFMIERQRIQVQEIDKLSVHLETLNEERNLARRKISVLEEEVGTSLYLDKILEVSRQVHGKDEATRRQGQLWIDRETETFLVTLGALNGLEDGDRITIYDGAEKLGYLRVITPLDVISYVYPVSKTLDDFEKDYYRVVIEE